MIKIYGDIQSGNCFKIKLLCTLLGIEHEWVHVDILAGETKTSDFLTKNPNAKIPLLELEDGRCLSESNAILNYLADGTELISEDSFERAKILQWQFLSNTATSLTLQWPDLLRNTSAYPKTRKKNTKLSKLVVIKP